MVTPASFQMNESLWFFLCVYVSISFVFTVVHRYPPNVDIPTHFGVFLFPPETCYRCKVSIMWCNFFPFSLCSLCLSHLSISSILSWIVCIACAPSRLARSISNTRQDNDHNIYLTEKQLQSNFRIWYVKVRKNRLNALALAQTNSIWSMYHHSCVFMNDFLHRQTTHYYARYHHNTSKKWDIFSYGSSYFPHNKVRSVWNMIQVGENVLTNDLY